MFRALPSPLPCRCTQKPDDQLNVPNGDEDGLHDVYDEGLGSKFRETAWKKPSEGEGGRESTFVNAGFSYLYDTKRCFNAGFRYLHTVLSQLCSIYI